MASEGSFKRLASCVHRVSRYSLMSVGYEPRFASRSGNNAPGGVEGPLHPSEHAAETSAHVSDPHSLALWENPAYRTLGRAAQDDLRNAQRGHRSLLQ